MLIFLYVKIFFLFFNLHSLIFYSYLYNNFYFLHYLNNMSMNMNVNIINQNYQGIKRNLSYSNSLLEHECHIMFVCEHWLKPSEL